MVTANLDSLHDLEVVDNLQLTMEDSLTVGGRKGTALQGKVREINDELYKLTAQGRLFTDSRRVKFLSELDELC